MKFRRTIPVVLVSLIFAGTLPGEEKADSGPDGFLSGFDIEAEKKKRYRTKRRVCGAKGWENCNAIDESRPNLMIVGDSLAADMQNVAWNIFGEEVNYLFSDLGGCPPHDEIAALLSPRYTKTDECLALNKARFQASYYDGVDAIFISVVFGGYMASHLGDYVSFLYSAGVNKVVVLGNYMLLGADLPASVAGLTREEASEAIRDLPGRWFSQNEDLNSLSGRLGFHYIDMERAFCQPECKLFFENDVPFTWDRFHLSSEAIAFLAGRVGDGVRAYILGDR